MEEALVFVFTPKDSSLYDGLVTGKCAGVGGACANGGAKYTPSEKINIRTNESNDGRPLLLRTQRSLQTSITSLSYY